MIDPEHDLPIKQQAEVLGISHSSVYYQPGLDHGHHLHPHGAQLRLSR